MHMSNDTQKTVNGIFTKRFAVISITTVAMALLLYSYFLPFMEVEKLIFFKSKYSLLYSLKIMWIERFYFLAVLIFIFSMVFPLAKLTAIYMLWFMPFSHKNREIVIHWLGVLGKWSMLDVFVVAIIIVLVKSQSLVSARPCIGIYVFAIAIMLSMLVSFIIERRYDEILYEK